MIGEKHIPQYKIDEVNYLIDLFNQYKNVAVIEVAHINDKQIQTMKKILRGKAIFRMSKKSLQIRAIELFKKKSKKANLDQLAANIPGQSSLIFTNLDLFELKGIFLKNEWMVPAKPDEITPVDIWVPEGDTGLPTGQVISELNMTLRLPTRIQNDTIWIREDTRTHKAGDLVDVKQAAVLKKLGVKPIESLIKIHFAWSDGEILPAEVLYMDMEQLQKDIASCYFTAQTLAIELGIIDEDTIKPLIQKAHREAKSILFEVPIFIEDMMDEYIKKAELNANIINSMVFGGGTVKSQGKESKKSKKKEPEPEEKEEEATGIGSLF
ncbi:MAG: 50S ribosomal protein L10 [Candidatus Hermodarchaeota archaeon]